MAQRLAGLRARLREQDLDAILITHPANRFYLSGYTASDTPPNESAGVLLITGAAAYLLTSPTNENQARAQATGFEVVPWVRQRQFAEALAPLLARDGVCRLGFEEEATIVSLYRSFEQAGGDKVELVAVGDLASELRLVKAADELARIARAAAITDAAFEAVARQMRPEQTEREVAWALERAMREGGADAIAFPVIVAAGPNGAFAHHDPTERTLGEGLPITIDMGAQVDGYAADLTRTVILGQPDEQALTIYRTLLRAVEAAEAGIRAGITAAAADALARDVIAAAGFGEYFGHGLGHGVGVAIHEAPNARKDDDTPLPAGATLTIEPGIYIPGWGGARIEDLVVIEEGGVRVLSRATKAMDGRRQA